MNYAKYQELLKNKCIRPTHRVGSGRYSQYYTYKGWEKDRWGEVPALTQIGLKYGYDYMHDNDAPKGGKCGDVIILTKVGAEYLKKILNKMAK